MTYPTMCQNTITLYLSALGDMNGLVRLPDDLIASIFILDEKKVKIIVPKDKNQKIHLNSL